MLRKIPRGHPRRLLLVAAAGVTVTVVGILIVVSSIPNDPPPSYRGPSNARVLFANSFRDEQWCPYHWVQNTHYSGPGCDYHGQSYSLTDDHGAARFEVRPGDSVGSANERSEISQDQASWQAREGDEWFVQERLRLAGDFQPGRAWTIITQFHAGFGSPPLSLSIDPDGALMLNSSGVAGQTNDAAGKRDRVLIPGDLFMGMRGQWFTVDLHVRWSNSVTTGGAEAYVNGQLVLPWRAQRTMASSRTYWKAGIYRAPSDVTQVLWLDDVVISTPQPKNR